MSAWIFSPDDKNFWEFMTPNFPKPMFGPISTLASADVDFLFFQKLTSGPLGPLRGHLDLFGAHLGPVRRLLGAHLGS